MGLLLFPRECRTIIMVPPLSLQGSSQKNQSVVHGHKVFQTWSMYSKYVLTLYQTMAGVGTPSTRHSSLRVSPTLLWIPDSETAVVRTMIGAIAGDGLEDTRSSVNRITSSWSGRENLNSKALGNSSSLELIPVVKANAVRLEPPR